MHGSRLFLIDDIPTRAARWRGEFRARMNHRKWSDRFPLTDVVVAPFGEIQRSAEGLTHIDRLFFRDAHSRGMYAVALDEGPETFTLEARKELLDLHLDLWAERQERAQEVVAVLPGWGHGYAKVLFVGDRYNGDRAAQLPFSNTIGASLTLTHLLNGARLLEADLYFANAFTADGAPALMTGGLRTLAPRCVVALGGDAAERLVELDVRSFIKFPNPLYLGHLPRGWLDHWGKKLRELVQGALD